MPRETSSWIRMMMGMLFSFVPAAGVQLAWGAIKGTASLWIASFQVGVVAAVFGFLLISLRERGLLYALVAVVFIAVVGGIFGRFQGSIITQMLLILGIEVVALGLLFTADYLGARSFVLRAVFIFIAGLISGSLVFAVLGAVAFANAGFFQGVVSGLPYIAAISLGVSLGVLLTRVAFGERQPAKTKEMT